MTGIRFNLTACLKGASIKGCDHIYIYIYIYIYIASSCTFDVATVTEKQSIFMDTHNS